MATNKYKIAGVVVEMNPQYQKLKTQAQPYAVSDELSTDINVGVSEKFLAFKHEQNPHLSMEDCEYLWYGFDFYKKLINFNGIFLHASCIAIDGQAYLFSAPCGTGKSTHTALWMQKFSDRAVYVNDDKPALRIIDNKIYACGTPFSGKTNLNTNVCLPLCGIGILRRSVTNSISRCALNMAIPKLFSQMLRPNDELLMKKTMSILSEILSVVPVYDVACNMEMQAADVAYDEMSKFHQ